MTMSDLIQSIEPMHTCNGARQPNRHPRAKRRLGPAAASATRNAPKTLVVKGVLRRGNEAAAGRVVAAAGHLETDR